MHASSSWQSFSSRAAQLNGRGLHWPSGGPLWQPPPSPGFSAPTSRRWGVEPAQGRGHVTWPLLLMTPFSV